MFCRHCGINIGDNEVCMGCGYNPLIDHKFCQNCGSKTEELQVVCIHCHLKLTTKKIKGFVVDKPQIPHPDQIESQEVISSKYYIKNFIYSFLLLILFVVIPALYFQFVQPFEITVNLTFIFMFILFGMITFCKVLNLKMRYREIFYILLFEATLYLLLYYLGFFNRETFSQEYKLYTMIERLYLSTFAIIPLFIIGIKSLVKKTKNK